MKYIHKLKSQEASSIKYGPCEICGRPVSEVHTLSTWHISQSGRSIYDRTVFGHKECLQKQRFKEAI